jgi:hypothetical protein
VETIFDAPDLVLECADLSIVPAAVLEGEL